MQKLEEEALRHHHAMALRRDRAAVLAKAMAAVLKNRFGVTKVELVGSIGDPEGLIRPDSDIDILVYGLDDSRYFEALGAVEEVAGGEFAVDLIRVEDVDPRARELLFRRRLSLE